MDTFPGLVGAVGDGLGDGLGDGDGVGLGVGVLQVFLHSAIALTTARRSSIELFGSYDPHQFRIKSNNSNPLDWQQLWQSVTDPSV
jgi:hypothetical protein